MFLYLPKYKKKSRSLHSSVNTGILNEKKLAPVHLATELNRVNALKIMGRYRKIIDIQKGGEHGRTALHLAAIHDHEECARILVGWVMFYLLFFIGIHPHPFIIILLNRTFPILKLLNFL